MRHNKILQNIDGRECTIYGEADADCLLLQPVDSHDLTELDIEVGWIENHSQRRFILVAVKIERWNAELTPWPAPPVFGKTPFGDGAHDTILYICNHLLPELMKHLSDDVAVFLGGYSLAGLFALWAGYEMIRFDGVAACSPSVWYQGWLDYARNHQPHAKFIYLSLGDKESHSRNQLMATVSECIEEQQRILTVQKVGNTLEWNQGNHFQNNGQRTAKGFVWLMNR